MSATTLTDPTNMLGKPISANSNPPAPEPTSMGAAQAYNESASAHPEPVAPTHEDANNDVEAQPENSEKTATNGEAYHHPLAQLGAVRKNFLLFIFAVATFV